LFELKKTDEVQKLIAITKSDSGVSGPKLAQAHMQLGALLAENIQLDPSDTTVIAILRGGIFLQKVYILNLDVSFKLITQNMRTSFDRKQRTLFLWIP